MGFLIAQKWSSKLTAEEYVMKKFLRSEGFTLVELMVVVAIIGILSAVAIPNFKKYQAKSKTSEAKLQLASIYSAETALMGDWDSFGSCLLAAGYVVAARGYYVVGFSADATTENGNIRTNAGVNAVCPDGEHQHSPADGGGTIIRVNGGNAAVGNLGAVGGETPIVSAGGETFIAQARGAISPDRVPTTTTQQDVWHIDENKSVRPMQIGY